nr:tripartite tricarboxylate transporter substrate-binding protein [Delftia sp.]
MPSTRCCRTSAPEAARARRGWHPARQPAGRCPDHGRGRPAPVRQRDLARPGGPLRTPAAVIKRINADVTKILNEPEVKEKLAEQGIETRPSTPQEMTKLVEKDTARWASVIKSAGIKAD